MATSAHHRSLREGRGRALVTTSWAVLLVVIALLSNWAHQDMSDARPSPHSAATQSAKSMSPPLTPVTVGMQLQAWLNDAKPSIVALFGAADDLVTAARYGDVAATGGACQLVAGAVGDVQRHVPSPDQTLNAKLQQAITSYQEGIRHCVPGAQNRDPVEISEARASTSRGSAELQAAVGIIEDDLCSDARDNRVWTV
jgi:hypothetical protein